LRARAGVFGGPQGRGVAIVDDDGSSVQSRPITAQGSDAMRSVRCSGRVPVARRRFPNALAPLEIGPAGSNRCERRCAKCFAISGGAAAKKVAAARSSSTSKVTWQPKRNCRQSERRPALVPCRPHRSKAPGAATQGRWRGGRCAPALPAWHAIPAERSEQMLAGIPEFRRCSDS